LALSDYDVLLDDVNATSDDKTIMQQNIIDALDAKNGAMVGLIGVGSLSAVVWIWNIIDVKKSKSQSYSSHNPVSVGINSRGQVEARILF